jgi:ComEC/Rec2-related protein
MKFVNFIALLTTRGLHLAIFAVAWIAGILIDDVLQVPPQTCLLLSGLTVLPLIICWHNQRDRLLLLMMLFSGLGAWRYAQAQPQYDPQSLQRFMHTSSSLSIRGVVADEPRVQIRTRLLMISVKAVRDSRSALWERAGGTIEVITLFNGPSAEDPYGANYGDSVEFQGKLQPPPPTSSKNIVASMGFPRIHVSATDGNAIITSIYHLRNQLAILIEQALPQPEAAILIAIFLGLHTPALTILASDFNVTGTAHLIASSGFKVTVLSGLVSRSTRSLLSEHTEPFPLTPHHKSWRDWARATLLLLGVALYTVLSGAGPAAQRAGIMGGLLIIAPRLGSKYNVYTGLAGAAILMSFIDPFVLWDVGFQLSFLGTLGIVLLAPYFQRLLQPIARLPTGFFIVEMIAVTLAAQVATWPIVAIVFHNVSLIAAIANTLTVPLLGPLIVLGLVISVTGLILHPLSLLCGWIAWPFLWYTQAAIELCARLPGAYIPVGPLDASIIWLYYALLSPASGFLLYRYPLSPTKHRPSLLTRRNRILLQAGSIVLIIVSTGITIVLPTSTASNTISFFDIDTTKAHGQDVHGEDIKTTEANKPRIYGEAIFVRTQDGKTLLIDGGNDVVSLSQLLDDRLPPWRRSLDMVILTSPQQDAITGLTDVLTRYDVGYVFDAGMAHPSTSYVRWRRIINERKLPYMPIAQGTTIPLGTSTQLQVLWPQDRLHTGSNEIRDNGLILRLVMPGLRLLLLGSSIQSNYALTGLLTSVDENMLKADIVQVLGEMNTPVPLVLTDVLEQAQPFLVVRTSSTQHKTSKPKSTNNTRATLSSALVSVPRVWETESQGTLELYSDGKGWGRSE